MSNKINMDRPEISSEEIARGKDFDTLMQQYQASQSAGQAGVPQAKPFYTKVWFVGGASVLAVTAVIATILLVQKPEKTESEQTTYTPETEAEQQIPTTETKPTLQAPFANITLPAANYSVNPAIGFETTYEPTGARINIPENAFVDETGAVITESVNVRYYQFTDATKIYGAGIPMTYEEGGENYHFESAGMIEVRAFVNGEQVFANPDKSITVELPTQQTSSDFVMYYLDEGEVKWRFAGEDNLRYESNLLAEATNDNWDYWATEEGFQMRNQIEEAEESFNTTQQKLQTLIAQKPIEPKKVDPTKERFLPVFSANEFPELAGYEHLMFEVGVENPQGILKSYDGTVVGDMVITQGTERGTYDVRFATNAGFVDVVGCVPVYSAETYPTALTRYTDAIEEFYIEKGALERTSNEAKTMLENLMIQVQEITIGGAVNNFITPVANNAASTVIRVFTIKSFGIYNCGSPQNLPSQAMVKATFIDQNGNDINPAAVWLAEKDRVVMFTYSNNSFEEFRFNPEARNVLWTVTDTGELAVFNEEDFSNMKKIKGKYEFVMRTYPIGSLDDLANHLDI